jgi:ribosomal protein L34E
MLFRARHGIPKWLLLPVGLVVVSALLLMVPLWIPVAMLWGARYRRRLRKAAESFRCSTCGSILGAAAVRRADEVWEAYVRELMRKNPDVRFRLVRTVHAICLSCGTPFKSVENDRTFEVQRRDLGHLKTDDAETAGIPRQTQPSPGGNS